MADSKDYVILLDSSDGFGDTVRGGVRIPSVIFVEIDQS